MKNFLNFHKIQEHHYLESKEDILDNFLNDKNLNKIEVLILALLIIQIKIQKDIKILDKNRKNKFFILINQQTVTIKVMKTLLNFRNLQKIMLSTIK